MTTLDSERQQYATQSSRITRRFSVLRSHAVPLSGAGTFLKTRQIN